MLVVSKLIFSLKIENRILAIFLSGMRVLGFAFVLLQRRLLPRVQLCSRPCGEGRQKPEALEPFQPGNFSPSFHI